MHSISKDIFASNIQNTQIKKITNTSDFAALCFCYSHYWISSNSRKHM